MPQQQQQRRLSKVKVKVSFFYENEGGVFSSLSDVIDKPLILGVCRT